jgi:DNA mismatch repair protein MutS
MPRQGFSPQAGLAHKSLGDHTSQPEDLSVKVDASLIGHISLSITRWGWSLPETAARLIAPAALRKSGGSVPDPLPSGPGPLAEPGSWHAPFRWGCHAGVEAAMATSPRDDEGGLAELAALIEGPRTGSPKTFRSILDRDMTFAPSVGAPEYFRDLNIDQIVAAVTAGKEEYDLMPFFCRRFDDADDIAYRQEVMQDLEASRRFELIAAFAAQMQEIRSRLRGVEKGYYRWQTNAWFLEAATLYCAAVRQLSTDLKEADPHSRGLRHFCDYLREYVGSAAFGALESDADKVRAALRVPKYCVQIRDLAVTVRKYEDEADYSAEIEATFAKFRRYDVKNYLIKFPDYAGMNHVEAQIAELVAKLYPDELSTLSEYCDKYRGFLDPTLQQFDREVQFYVAYLEYIGRIRKAGLAFCYPDVARQVKTVLGSGVFDLALAAKLTGEGKPVVPNDFTLRGDERVLVISGPNQGGKTTFARTFGQLHHFASLGCPVPGTDTQLFLPDRILTHFEMEESIENLHGKLQHDLLRVHRILEEATPDSLIIMNEIFSSTALEDAVFLATRVMQRIIALDCLCVCVTFLDEVAGLGPTVVSMVSTVVPENPAQRTLKLVRRPADGRAYAMAIAEKHRLTYGAIKERLARSRPPRKAVDQANTIR